MHIKKVSFKNFLISYLIFIIYKYDSFLKDNSFDIKNKEKMSFRSLILGIFSIIFLGPIVSYLLLLPFISIFQEIVIYKCTKPKYI